MWTIINLFTQEVDVYFKNFLGDKFYKVATLPSHGKICTDNISIGGYVSAYKKNGELLSPPFLVTDRLSHILIASVMRNDIEQNGADIRVFSGFSDIPSIRFQNMLSIPIDVYYQCTRDLCNPNNGYAFRKNCGLANKLIAKLNPWNPDDQVSYLGGSLSDLNVFNYYPTGFFVGDIFTFIDATNGKLLFQTIIEDVDVRTIQVGAMSGR